ncbi:MAG: ComF family protein [Acidobacteria bacterium]|nr:ComF family protein [Acidobacteriota bacterium]MCA1638620.1 ComF family protein [Acidobacteriota bacterium]
MLQKIYDSLLTLTYPQACQICQNSVENSSDGVACRACWKKTRIFFGEETLCHKCGAFLQAKPSNFQTFCHHCDEHFYDAACAVGSYEHALSASVLHLKRETFVAKRLKKLFVSRFQNSAFQDTTKVVPVPLSKKRFLERGFNQAAILAKILSEQTGVALDEQSLARRVHTPMHRVGMDNKARATSVKNAFEVKRAKFIEGETILLVDDVFTSGATVSSCAKVLKENGARRVYILTLARAV